MMHQIRKMVGLAIAVLRGLASSDVITKAWGKDRVDVPIAPSLGLVLEEPHYDKYNLRYGSDGIHESLNWEKAVKKIQDFREEFIDSTIINTEIQEKSMLNWLATLPLHTYDVRDLPTDEEQAEAKGSQSQTRSALGRAKVNLSKHQDNSDDDDDADDEDGDLDQYRITTLGKKVTDNKEVTEVTDRIILSDNGEVSVNGLDNKETVETDSSNDKEKC